MRWFAEISWVERTNCSGIRWESHLCLFDCSAVENSGEATHRLRIFDPGVHILAKSLRIKCCICDVKICRFGPRYHQSCYEWKKSPKKWVEGATKSRDVFQTLFVQLWMSITLLLKILWPNTHFRKLMSMAFLVPIPVLSMRQRQRMAPEYLECKGTLMYSLSRALVSLLVLLLTGFRFTMDRNYRCAWWFWGKVCF